MVDLAVNIAQNTEFYLKAAQPLQVADLAPMAEEVRVMVREVLDAFVRSDAAMARGVLSRDDRVDDFKRKILNEVIRMMKDDSAFVDSGLNVILVAKNLERIGDHATNIAEDVIFVISGQDIRHRGTEVSRAIPGV
jgi:phosphate transport system protein